MSISLYIITQRLYSFDLIKKNKEIILLLITFFFLLYFYDILITSNKVLSAMIALSESTYCFLAYDE